MACVLDWSPVKQHKFWFYVCVTETSDDTCTHVLNYMCEINFCISALLDSVGKQSLLF